MEEWIPHEASKEGRSQSVFKIQGNNIAVRPDKVFNRVLLNRLKDAVDPHIRDHHQAGFREETILRRSDRHAAHHLGAVTGIELVTSRHFFARRSSSF